MEQLLKTIQARKVDRVAAGYAVAGWVLVQAASIALPAFDAPGWTLKALILFLVLGFPVAIAVSWMGAPHLAAGPARPVGLTPVRLALYGTALVAIVLSLGEFVLWLSHSRSSPPGPAPYVASNAIAVLPFTNMSGDRGREYISDGISEELLNDLANFPQLRVAARASSFAFKGKNEDIKTIARLLAVGSVLEGSVREEGQHLRIHAELIDAVTGYDIWSASFDRDMTHVLAMEDEIARAIVGALTHKLLPKASQSRLAVIDAEAYREYLQGQQALAPRTEAGTEQAVALFRQAIARQPDFTDAFAGLARAYVNLAQLHSRRKDEFVSAAGAAADRALALGPDNLDALTSHLDVALWRLDFRTARRDALKMQAINPHNETVLHEMQRYYGSMGFPAENLRAAENAVQLDRLSIVARINLAAGWFYSGRFAEAAKAAQDALVLYPNQPIALETLCGSYAYSHRVAEAKSILARLNAVPGADGTYCAFLIEAGQGRDAQAHVLLDKVAPQFSGDASGASEIGFQYAMIGDDAKATAWLNRAYDLRELQLFAFHTNALIPAAYFGTPGWQALSQRPLFRQWQAVHDAIARDLGR